MAREARRHGFELAQCRREESADEDRTTCDGCGGPLDDTPSQLREHCIVCLAERFGGDLVEEQMVKQLIGGMVKTAMGAEDISGDLVVASAEAIRDYDQTSAFNSGRSCERSGWSSREAVA